MSRARFVFGAALVVAAGFAGVSCADTEEGQGAPGPSALLPDGSSIDGGDGGDPLPISCDEVSWCPSPTGISSVYVLTKVWGSSANDVWAIGSGGTVVHWDGTTWRAAPVPPSPTPIVYTFRALWGSGPNDVWLAGSTEMIFRNTGGGWVKQTEAVPKPNEAPVFAIWGDDGGRLRLGTRSYEFMTTTPEGDIWQTGHQFTKVGDGAALVWEPRLGTATVLGYYGSAEDLWLIGDNSIHKPWQNALTMHGVRAEAGADLVWTEVESYSAPRLHAIWGSSSSEIWAVGDQGVMRRMRPGQTSWEIVPSVTTESLRALWGTSATDIWAAGESGTILHYDGASWTPDTATFPTGKDKPLLTGIWGSSPSDVWIVGGDVALHYTGKKGGSP